MAIRNDIDVALPPPISGAPTSGGLSTDAAVELHLPRSEEAPALDTFGRRALDPIARRPGQGDGSLGLTRPNPGNPRRSAGRGEWISPLYPGPTDRQVGIRAGVTPISRQTADGARPGAISLLHQGKTNACGTTSLSMVLRYWQGASAQNTVAAIDRAIRPGNSPTDPREIQALAQRQGLRAGVVRNATPTQLAGLIDQGTPPIIVLHADNFQFHYVVVTGYERTVENGETEVEFTLADPAAGVRTLSRDELEEQWALNYLISFAPSGSQRITGLDRRQRRADQLDVPNARPDYVDAATSAGIDAISPFL
ncbi:MAG: cysteine peptidase family C39 domain-containing protein [Myxococcota bacterium]